MDPDENGGNPYRINRREALKRAALVTGAAWAAPVLTSLRTPAFAQYGVPCQEGCTYAIDLEAPTFACSECEGEICVAACTDCAGPSCARITSISRQDTTIRFCTDCTLPNRQLVCYRCPDPPSCTCDFYFVDPSDARCGIVPDHQSGCPNRQIRIFFNCVDCTP